MTLTADVKGTSIYTSGNLRIEGGVFDIDSPSIGLRALGNLSIVNAQIDVISGSNPISADGALIIGRGGYGDRVHRPLPRHRRYGGD